jgi:hypothetical protein
VREREREKKKCGGGERERERSNFFFKKKVKVKKYYFNDIENIKRIYCRVFLDRESKSSFIPYI